MPVIPDTRRGKIEFYSSHLETWAAHAARIGVTVAQVDALAAKVAAARAALLAQQEAEQAARAATAAFHTAAAAMHADGMTLIGAIRQAAAQAGLAGGAVAAGEVYVAAHVPPPAPKRRLPPPGRPTDVRIALLGDGTLRLTWKCRNPRGAIGTLYEIRRRDGLGAGVVAAGAAAGGITGIAGGASGIAGGASGIADRVSGIAGGPASECNSRLPGAEGTRCAGTRADTVAPAGAAFVHLATVGVKHFVDESPPAGVGTVTYSIRAIRSTQAGPEELLLVNLGVRPLRAA